MLIELITRHAPDFDLISAGIDPGKSPYAPYVGDQYARRITAFYNDIGVTSAVWTWPSSQPPQFFEPCKPIEYVLDVDETRVIAYVDEDTWSPYLFGKRSSFNYSRCPVKYPITSMLIESPVRIEEIREIRRYRVNDHGQGLLEETRKSV